MLNFVWLEMKTPHPTFNHVFSLCVSSSNAFFSTNVEIAEWLL